MKADTDGEQSRYSTSTMHYVGLALGQVMIILFVISQSAEQQGKHCNRILTGTEKVGDSKQRALMFNNEEAIQNLIAADIQNQ